jgi:hypothetical protein
MRKTGFFYCSVLSILCICCTAGSDARAQDGCLEITESTNADIYPVGYPVLFDMRVTNNCTDPITFVSPSDQLDGLTVTDLATGQQVFCNDRGGIPEVTVWSLDPGESRDFYEVWEPHVGVGDYVGIGWIRNGDSCSYHTLNSNPVYFSIVDP